MFHYILLSFLSITFCQTLAFDLDYDAVESLEIVYNTVNNLTDIFKRLYKVYEVPERSEKKHNSTEQLNETFKNLEQYLPKLNFTKYDFYGLIHPVTRSDKNYNKGIEKFDNFRNWLYLEQKAFPFFGNDSVPKTYLEDKLNLKLQELDILDDYKIRVDPHWQSFVEIYRTCDGSGLPWKKLWGLKITSSLYQSIYQFYSDIFIPTEIRILIMRLFFSNMHKFYSTKPIFSDKELNIEAQEHFIDRIAENSELIKNILIEDSQSNRLINKCHEIQELADLSTVEVFQSYIYGIIDKSRIFQTRVRNKELLKSDLIYEDNVWESLYCTAFQSKFKCEGDLMACALMDTNSMQVCPEKSRNNNSSLIQRYKEIFYLIGNQKVGTKISDQCWKSMKNPKGIVSNSKPDCDYYECQCEDLADNINRYFDLRAAKSDIKNNKVVTGLRFIERNHVFHLQIQQGQLIKNRAVNLSTVEWKSIDFFDPLSNFTLEQNVDYFKVTSQSNKIIVDMIDTEDTEVYKNHAVTGFQFMTYNENKILYLSIQLTPADFKTGQLDANKAAWFEMNDSTKAIPFRASFHALAGHYTMPFISLKESAPKIPIPLSGGGLLMKTMEYDNEHQIVRNLKDDKNVTLNNKINVLLPVGISPNLWKLYKIHFLEEY